MLKVLHSLGLNRQMLVIFVASMSLTLVFGITPVAPTLDGLLVDTVMSRAGNGGRTTVLVVGVAPSEAFAAADWLSLVDAVRDAEPAAVAVTRLPASVDGEQMRSELARRDVLLGRTRAQVRTQRLSDPGTSAAVAINEIPEPDEGIHRHHHMTFPLGDAALPSLPLALARRLGATVLEERTPERFGVNFMHTGPLPSLSATQVLAGNLIPELVRDRAVLIGPAPAGGAPRLQTPLKGRHGDMSATRFHAHATDTLVRDRVIRPPAPWVHALVLVMVAAVTIIALSALGVRGFWFTLTTVAATPIIAAALLALAHLRIAVSDIVFLQVIASALTTRNRVLGEERALRRIIVDSGSRLRQRIPASTFLESREHWHQIVNLVNQTLDLDRLLFLERDPGAHRVVEIVARGCSIDDIVEQRRDYDREPYRSAIQRRELVRLDKPFLTAAEGEEQYLVPLSFAGEVQGFWAFSLTPDEHRDPRQFSDSVVAFADQIAQLLHQRKEWQEERDEDAPVARGRPEARSRAALRGTVAAIERRLEIFEDVFASQQTATIVYDLFGQVIQTNHAMDAILDAMSFHTFTNTALDLLVTASGREAGYCQGMLRYVILQRRPLAMPVQLSLGEPGPGRESEREFQLTLSPVGATATESTADEVRPFELAGLMIELQDVTHLHQLAALKEDLIERMGFRLRGDAEAIVLATSLLEDPSLEEGMRKDVIKLLVERTESATRVIEQVRNHLDLAGETAAESGYPLDAVVTLQRAMATLEPRADEKRLTFDVNTPHYPQLAVAEPESLAHLMHAIVSLLIDDASAGSSIAIRVEESAGEQRISLYNAGFGLPPERFRHYLEDPDAAAGPEYERLRDAGGRIESWGGRFEATAELGGGFRFEIVLITAI